MKLIYTLFTHGDFVGRGFAVDIPAFKKANRIKNPHLLFKVLSDYGFVFSGLINYKITPKSIELTIDYPDNPNVIIVLARVAGKAAKANAEELFYRWSFRLLSEPFGSFSYTDPFYAVYDKARTPEEKTFINAFHRAMRERGYYWQGGGGNEGPGIRYYDKESVMKRKGPYLFQLWDNKGELQLYMRVRNADKCISHYKGIAMPDEIAEMFRHSDHGCGNHAEETCDMGIEYVFEGEKHWHCGCCGALFWLRPKVESISHYIKMHKIGEKKEAKKEMEVVK